MATKYIIYDGPACRLDKASEALIPELGIRGRRRQIEKGRVLVDGKRRAAGWNVPQGAELRLEEEPQHETAVPVLPLILRGVPRLLTDAEVSEGAPQLPVNMAQDTDSRFPTDRDQSADFRLPASHSHATEACFHAGQKLFDSAPRTPRNLKEPHGESATPSDTGQLAECRFSSDTGQLAECRLSTDRGIPGKGCSVSPAETPGGGQLALHEAFCFFFKPAGLHTAAIAGSGTRSLEELIPQMRADCCPAKKTLPPARNCPPGTAPQQAAETFQPRLVQRLDFGTSGIVAAALSPEAVQSWRELENRGLCRKRYLTLLCGELTAPCENRAALDTQNRSQTKVLARPAEMLRRTAFTPLTVFRGAEARRLQTLFEVISPDNIVFSKTNPREIQVLLEDWIANATTSASAPALSESASGSTVSAASVPVVSEVASGLPRPTTPVSVVSGVASGSTVPTAPVPAVPESASGPAAASPVFTLAGCQIRKGARHQIRAHAAALVFPLCGDQLYGGGSGVFFLHHAALSLPGINVILPPRWLSLLPAAAQAAALDWLRK